MPITVLPKNITPAMRPFVMAVGNPDGTVTLYYRGEALPVFNPSPPVLEASQYQFKMALIEINRWNAFKTAYATLTDKEKVTIDHRRVIRSTDPVIIKILNAVGATPEQMMALFEFARTVVDE